MANPIFYYNAGITYSTLTATTADTLYPLSNLNLGFPDKGWRGESYTSPFYVTWRTDSHAMTDRTWTLFSGVNFSSVRGYGATIVLQSSATVAFSTPTTVTTILDDTNGMYLATYAAQSNTYYRLVYTGLMTVYPIIGMIYTGNQLNYGFTPSLPFRSGKGSWNTSEFEAIDGRIHSGQNSGSRLLWDISFDYAPTSLNTSINQFFTATRGKLNPFWYKDHNDNYYYVKLDIDQDPTEYFRAGFLNVKKIAMKTVLKY
jgi:hypothetical protein